MSIHFKSKATKEEVAKTIENFVNGSDGPWDWDDFISVRIADEELEAIRIECLRTQSDYPGDPNHWCNEEGLEVLRSLAKQLRSRQ
jgi:hypothetical protein